ncbi:MAG: hypothetical protein WCG87_12005 [Bacteroidota bacterium]
MNNNSIVRNNSSDSEILQAFQWWEKWRVFFNLMLGLTCLSIAILFYTDMTLAKIAGLLIWMLAINIFYFSCFGIEIALLHYSKGKYNLAQRRQLFFFISTFCWMMASLTFILSINMPSHF